MGVTTVTSVTGVPLIKFHARACGRHRRKPVTLVTVVTQRSYWDQDRCIGPLMGIATQGASTYCGVPLDARATAGFADPLARPRPTVPTKNWP
jgi:hypothetical protein